MEGCGRSDGVTWESAIPAVNRLGGPSEWGNSRWKDFLQCPFKYYAKHVRGLTVAPSHPRYEALGKNLWVGGLYHEARALYYLRNLDFVSAKGERIDDTPQGQIDKACTNAMFGVVDLAATIQPLVASEARRLLVGWMTLNGPGTLQDDRDKTMYVEELLAVSSGGFPYTCRIDRVVWDDELDGPVIQEHKTASFYSESLLASYRTDAQILGQIYLWENSPMKKKHGSLKAFEVDIAVKKAQREYHRVRVPINLSAVDDWARCMRIEHASLVSCMATETWPRRRANCFLWARACEFQEACGDCAAGGKRLVIPGFQRKKK